jgi:amino-acid N-acetyltransferase
MHLKPAEYAILVFKGVRKLARAINRDPSSVSRWSKPKSEKGSDGFVPRGAQRLILDSAKAQGLDITPQDLIEGREVG